MIELATVADLLELLAKPQCSEALVSWVEVIGPQLGGDTWLNDGGVELTALLNVWAPQWQDALVAAIQEGREGSGAALVSWLYAAQAAGRAGIEAGIEDIGPWESVPGWWTGIDAATGEWMAVESAERPTAATVGWVPCASVLAGQASGPESATSSQAETWYEGEPQPIPERDGWWAVRDFSGQWWAVQATECPDAQTQGWIVYEEAFAEPQATDPQNWVQVTPSDQADGRADAARRGTVFGGHRSADAEPTQPAQASTSSVTSAQGPGESSGESQYETDEEPLDDKELMDELIEHNKIVVDRTASGQELPLVIIAASGGMFDRQTKGYGCLLAPTGAVLRSRQPYFEGTVRVRREQFKWYLDFIDVPQEYRSACACCMGLVQSYDMEFLDSSGAQIQDSGAFRPYTAQFGGSIADRIPEQPDFESAAAVNADNLFTLDPELMWQLGRNGLLLIGERMLDESSQCGHTTQNLRAMAEYAPGQVVGGGRVSYRQDRKGRVTAFVFHSVSAANHDAVMKQAKRAVPKVEIVCT